MNATNAFFIWFFEGLNGLGGWFIFLLLALAGVIWLFYDSSNRRIPALGWRMGIVLLAVLLLPAIIFRFSSSETRDSLSPFVETIFYLGILGGILPPILAIGYYVTFKDMVGCPQGHVYEKALGQCPECAAPVVPVMQQAAMPYNPPPVNIPFVPDAQPARPMPAKAKANAWLIAGDRQYQLCMDETTIGRHSSNDIQLSGEMTVSKFHAKILEKNGRFYLVDLASTAGTMINNRSVRQSTLLEPDDEIRFGESAVMNFMTRRR
jgi:hypothetical protein